MKVQIRRGVFETNSSSTHAISIIRKSNIKEYPDTVVFDEGEYGWEFDTYYSTADKASYLWEAIIGYYWQKPDKVKELMQTITDTLAKHNIKAVFPYHNIKTKTHTYDNGETYTYIECTNDEGEKDDGFVDHSGDFDDFIDTVVNNERKLMNYLFDYNSYIATGNDNSDEELDCPDYGSAWYFEKGN